jgi:hypothetical protein
MNTVSNFATIMKSISTLPLSWTFVAFAAALVGGFGATPALAITGSAQYVPHRAIYEMKLDSSRASANISDVRGRLVFDFTGSPCEGYTLNTRLVTQITDTEGQRIVSDLRSSTWEDGQGKRFLFNSSQYLNNQLTESLMGRAERGDDEGIAIEIEKPQPSRLRLEASTRFPTQYSLEVLQAALQGRFVIQSTIYDGSEQGDKLFDTTAIIGKPIEARREALDTPEVSEELEGLRSWPVSISYFEVGAATDQTPSYELSFRLYENGVSRNLQINYGEFTLTGELSQLQLYEQASCAE